MSIATNKKHPKGHFNKLTQQINMNHKILDGKDFYRTADLGLIVVISLSYPIELIDRQNPKKAEFLFETSNELIALVESYWRGELLIEPQKYFNQLKIIKTRLYSHE